MAVLPRVASEIPPRVPFLQSRYGELLHFGLLHSNRLGMLVGWIHGQEDGESRVGGPQGSSYDLHHMRGSHLAWIFRFVYACGPRTVCIVAHRGIWRAGVVSNLLLFGSRALSIKNRTDDRYLGRSDMDDHRLHADSHWSKHR